MCDENNNDSIESTENNVTVHSNDNINISDDKTIVDAILNATDADRLNDLTQVFNLFQTKRRMLQLSAMDDVKDSLIKQMKERLEKYPDNFDNADIANWFKVIHQSIDSSEDRITKADKEIVTPILQNNNTNVNINVENTIPRESREKILDIIRGLIGNSDDNTSEGDGSEND